MSQASDLLIAHVLHHVQRFRDVDRRGGGRSDVGVRNADQRSKVEYHVDASRGVLDTPRVGDVAKLDITVDVVVCERQHSPVQPSVVVDQRSYLRAGSNHRLGQM